MWDEETGLNYHLHRYYDRVSGRYVQADPMKAGYRRGLKRGSGNGERAPGTCLLKKTQHKTTPCRRFHSIVRY
ncbi:hypothetical protein M5C95_22020 [Acidovorax sp. NCPPB 4044]|nr:hypothetical protein [Acidovorax sp. NCPPB 4044]